MRTVLVIGIGAGDPDHVTIQALRALERVDALLIVDKDGPAGTDLAAVREAILERHLGARQPRRIRLPEVSRDRMPADYEATIDDWRAARLAAYERAIDALGSDETAAFLVWGDPSVYDGTVPMLDEVRARGLVDFDLQVIPGITAASALAASHRIALNGIGESVLFTTGRRLAAEGLADHVDNAVVFLDGGQAYRDVADDVDVWWGAFLASDDESLVAGRLTDCRDEIERTRAELRARKGWMFDTYLLRRRRP